MYCAPYPCFLSMLQFVTVKLCYILLLQVFHLHIILGIQDLLCVWLYAPSISHLSCCHCVCDYCMYILPSQCRRLPLVSFFCLF